MDRVKPMCCGSCGHELPPVEKWCIVCDTIKPVSDFYTHKTTRDKLYPECIDCLLAKRRKGSWRKRLK